MKEVSVIEGSHGDLSAAFIAHGATGTLTAQNIIAELVRPRCGHKLSTSALTSDERSRLHQALPVALQMFPDRYVCVCVWCVSNKYTVLTRPQLKYTPSHTLHVTLLILHDTSTQVSIPGPRVSVARIFGAFPRDGHAGVDEPCRLQSAGLVVTRWRGLGPVHQTVRVE